MIDVATADPVGYGAMIHVDNVNEALPLGIQLMMQTGQPVVSRGLETLEVPGPVSTIYKNPTRRVLFDAERDANPFFHMIDSLWLLSGSNRVDLPAFFLPSIMNYSDNGRTFHGAYGWRLRNGAVDQIRAVVDLLKDRPDTRQAVLSIWDAALDFGTTTKDMPCNDMIMLGIRNGMLHMTVCNRSNDMVWGAYGANAVQFSYLQEFIARAVGVEVGYYTQQSNSFHVYTANEYWRGISEGTLIAPAGHVVNPYMQTEVQPMALLTMPQEADYFLEDCAALETMAWDRSIGTLINKRGPFESTYFQAVVQPAIAGLLLYREGDHTAALQQLEDVEAPDWRLAMQEWVLRRKERAAEATRVKYLGDAK